MRPAVVLVLADGPSPPDPGTGCRRYEGGYLAKVVVAHGAIPITLASLALDLSATTAARLCGWVDLVAVGSQPKAEVEKVLIEEARHAACGLTYGVENLEAWLEDRRSR